jgi:hypothetical protein
MLKKAVARRAAELYKEETTKLRKKHSESAHEHSSKAHEASKNAHKSQSQK